MKELLAQFLTPEVQGALAFMVFLLVVLYVLVVVWTARDAYLRGARWQVWAVVSLVPVVGVIAYVLLRPPLYEVDRQEQELEVALKRRELMNFGECANCGYPVHADYILCPHCHARLKNLCPQCHHALDSEWTVCPYCGTPAHAAQAHPHAARTQ